MGGSTRIIPLRRASEGSLIWFIAQEVVFIGPFGCRGLTVTTPNPYQPVSDKHILRHCDKVTIRPMKRTVKKQKTFRLWKIFLPLFVGNYRIPILII